MVYEASNIKPVSIAVINVWEEMLLEGHEFSRAE
jgi:hypothetical protein